MVRRGGVLNCHGGELNRHGGKFDYHGGIPSLPTQPPDTHHKDIHKEGAAGGCPPLWMRRPKAASFMGGCLEAG